MAKRHKANYKKSEFHSLVSFVIWITGVLVALAVGFGMIDGVLKIRFIPDILTIIAGWIVVILTILGIILALIEKSSG